MIKSITKTNKQIIMSDTPIIKKEGEVGEFVIILKLS